MCCTRLAENTAPTSIYSVPAQETAKHRAKFGWHPLSDVAAVTKPRRETRWNMLVCRKLANRSQPLVGRSSPHCDDLWRRYCCLTVFFQLSIRALVAGYSPTKLCDGAKMAIFLRNFCVLYFSEPRAAYFRHAFWIRTKATSCGGSMVDIQSPTAENRRGEKKKEKEERKKETTATKYNGLPNPVGRS